MMSEQDINDQFKMLWEAYLRLSETLDDLTESLYDLKLTILIAERGAKNVSAEKPVDP